MLARLGLRVNPGLGQEILNARRPFLLDARPRLELRATCLRDFEPLARARREELFFVAFFELRALVFALRDFDDRPAGSANVTEHVRQKIIRSETAICFRSLFEVIRTTRPLSRLLVKRASPPASSASRCMEAIAIS